MMRMGLVSTCILFIFLSIMPWEARAAHGDNMNCPSCGVLMEYAFRVVTEYADREGQNIDLTQMATVEVDFSKEMENICERKVFDNFAHDLRRGCRDITEQFSKHVSAAFDGDEPTEFMQYEKSTHICVNLLDYCDAKELPEDFNPRDECKMCQTVAADLLNTVDRRRSTAKWRSKELVYSDLDEVCSSITVRHPNKIVRHVSEMCSIIVEENEHSVADVLMYSATNAKAINKICGPDIVDVCPEGAYGGPKSIWISPFFQEPYYTNKRLFDVFLDDDEKGENNDSKEKENADGPKSEKEEHGPSEASNDEVNIDEEDSEVIEL